MEDRDYFLNIVSSKGKMKILKVLIREGQVNITRLVKETGLHYNLVLKHLNDLIKAGIVEETRLGRLRLYTLKLNNPKTIILMDVIRALGES